MIKTALILLISFALYFTTWEEYINYEGRFRILTPGALTLKVDTVETAVGKIAYHTFYLQTMEKGADNLFYMVSYCDYPENTFPTDSTALIEAFFQNTVEAAGESVKGNVMYASDFQLQDFPGKIWRIDYLDGKAVIKTKALLVNDRFYSIQTISHRDKNINHDGEKFLESFRIL
jgi:hypothetical protein